MKKILLAVDEKPTSKRAIQQAVKLAQAMGASLYLMHIIELLSTYAKQAKGYYVFEAPAFGRGEAL